MIMVKQIKNWPILVTMDKPEQKVLNKIAAAYSISANDALVAIINRGMDSIGNQLRAEANKVTNARNVDANDYGGD